MKRSPFPIQFRSPHKTRISTGPVFGEQFTRAIRHGEVPTLVGTAVARYLGAARQNRCYEHFSGGRLYHCAQTYVASC